jgi:hypothetical protein
MLTLHAVGKTPSACSERSCSYIIPRLECFCSTAGVTFAPPFQFHKIFFLSLLSWASSRARPVSVHFSTCRHSSAAPTLAPLTPVRTVSLLSPRAASFPAHTTSVTPILFASLALISSDAPSVVPLPSPFVAVVYAVSTP